MILMIAKKYSPLRNDRNKFHIFYKCVAHYRSFIGRMLSFYKDQKNMKMSFKKTKKTDVTCVPATFI